ncbi:MAG TPA: PDR/VanB family oxidoreductase [Povalibacter sp.]|uniref:PDR/VanB family oxidoreductase n=1 Tax=Povalibacter sp. TaxID=1962978 RepID=UPI002C4EDDBD|nr:PDR/VanB family oxidoreductase [Povalibacter sp.]HMN43797.1 PDR/VanB family oxidoreductase [Povalibacter sp.]
MAVSSSASAIPLLQVCVRRKRHEADDICSLELVDPQGRALPPFSAGSHIDLHLPNGLVRQYSLCNPPTERHSYLVAVLKDPASRGGSQAVHTLVHEGDTIQISEPRNHFELVPSEHAILLGGGIGITPVLCMAERLSQTGASFELHYCSRSPSRTAFKSRIEASAFADRAAFHFDDGEASQKLDIDRALGAPAAGKHLFVCGPNGFMDWVINCARKLAWAEDHIHREYFAAAAVDTSADGSFDVTIASTGTTLRVQKDEAVTTVLARNGFEVPTSCEQGVCGTCLVRVLEGDIEHRDVFLTDDEHRANDQFTPCVSRAKAGCKRLVLDL